MVDSDGCEKQWRILRMQTIPGMVILLWDQDTDLIFPFNE